VRERIRWKRLCFSHEKKEEWEKGKQG